MNKDQMESLVLSYFKGVDAKDFKMIQNTISQDCRLTVETHSVELNGHQEIESMFENLWKNHKAVLHHNFKFLTDAASNKISVQFNVVNTLQNDKILKKSNCNFFTIEQNKFNEINIYMAGENTIIKS
jgi:hypothetical protein